MHVAQEAAVHITFLIAVHPAPSGVDLALAR